MTFLKRTDPFRPGKKSQSEENQSDSSLSLNVLYGWDFTVFPSGIVTIAAYKSECEGVSKGEKHLITNRSQTIITKLINLITTSSRRFCPLIWQSIGHVRTQKVDFVEKFVDTSLITELWNVSFSARLSLSVLQRFLYFLLSRLCSNSCAYFLSRQPSLAVLIGPTINQSLISSDER